MRECSFLEDWAEFVEMPTSLDDVVLQNEVPGAPFWMIVDIVRDGRKDKLG